MAGGDEEIALLADQGRCRRRFSTLKATGCAALCALLLAAAAAATLLGWSRFNGGKAVGDENAALLMSDGDFTVAASAAAALNFLAVGDWGRRGMYNQSLVARQMGIVADLVKAKFVISTGDNFYKNGLTGVGDVGFDQSFSNIYTAKSLQIPWHAVLGNHDYHGDVLSQLDPKLSLRDWRWSCLREGQLVYGLGPGSPLLSKDATALELFFFDTTPFLDSYFSPGKNTFDWRGILPDRALHLEQKLENLSTALKASSARWKIVVGHHTIRSFGNHGDSAELAKQLLPILEANNVDVYLNGHDHCLEHIKRDDCAVHFVTSGGGSKAWKGVLPTQNANGLQFFYDGQGFVSVSVTDVRLLILFHDIYGSILHRLHLSKPGSTGSDS